MSAPDDLIGRILVEAGPSPVRRSQGKARPARQAPMLSLQEAIDGLPEQIAILDRRGRVLSLNRAWLRAPGPRNVAGLPHRGASYVKMWQAMRSQEALGTARGIRSLLRGTRTRFTCQFRSSHPNRWSELSVTRIDVGGSFNLLVVHRDVTDAERSARALRVLSRRLIRAQEAERRRIARELHDQTAQNLTAISLSLARLELAAPPGDTTMPALLGESRALAQRSVAQLRTLSYLLHPPLLDDEGLVSALRWYVSGFVRRSGIRTDLRVRKGFGRVPRDVELALFPVVQECLANVYRHSASGKAFIRLRRNDRGVTVEVSNRGPRALSAEQRAALQKQEGLGIRSIRERLHVVGGTFELRPGEKGVTAIATVPLRRRNQPHAHPHRR